MLSCFGDALRTAAPPLPAAGFALAVAPGQASIGLLILPAFILTTLWTASAGWAPSCSSSGSWAWLWNVNTTTLMQQRSPAELLGRVGAAFPTLAYPAPAHGRFLRPRGHRADTRAQAGRTCCCPAGRHHNSSWHPLIN
ncbi:MFS transporter [Streptomyces diastatochromogenes]|uniref:hypothetical protein n=1 Tax=Streptomyces diastatochromogenes TaxID=42236 RepID=UPI00369D5B39